MRTAYRIFYRMREDGGFVVGEMGQEVAAYAYPTSPHATAAKKNPNKVAREMIAKELKAVPSNQNKTNEWLLELQIYGTQAN